VPAIRKAFRVSQEGVPGPVFIEYPLDVIWPRDMLEEILGLSKAAATTAGAKEKGKEQGADEKQGKSDAQGAKEGQSPRGKAPKSGAAAIRGRVMERVQQLYLQHHIHRVFDRAFEIPPPSLLSKPTVLFASQQAVAAVAARLTSSSRPLVLVGSQAVFRSAQVGALVKALERLQAPCFLSGMARGLLGEAHRLQMRHKRSSALARADFVLLLGVPMDFRLDYGRHVGKGAFLALVNLDSVTLRKNSDIRAVDARVLADPLNFAVQLAERATAAPPPAAWGEWAKALEALQAKREREIDAMALAESKQPGARFVSPLRLCREIDAALDANSVVVADGGDFVGTASYIVRPRSPLSWLDPGVFGTLGVGGGFAMGAHAVRPQAEVWVLFGDGSVGWSLSEFDTYVRHKIPVIAVVGNDACWSQMYRDQVRLLKDPVATELAQTRYDEVVRGFGAEGILVRSEDEVAPALQRAKALAKQGRPVLVNVFINRSQFREGSISL
jgi:acetolactate synthase-1/2/3 large subunit